MPTARTAAIVLFCTLILPPAIASVGHARQQQADCARTQELYRACHALGRQSADAAGCEEAGREHIARFLRAAASGPGGSGQAARAQAAVVCATACDDAATGQAPATDQEVAEAFCDQPAPAKQQGARP